MESCGSLTSLDPYHKDNFDPLVISKTEIQSINSTIFCVKTDSNSLSKEDQQNCILIYELICDIKDPEHDNTLEELGVITMSNIFSKSIFILLTNKQA